MRVQKNQFFFGLGLTRAGNSNPDIELLAPIARLLHISLDILLSFHENLTDVEITELIQEMDKMFSLEGYEKTY